jgi:hypothetical protein
MPHVADGSLRRLTHRRQGEASHLDDNLTQLIIKPGHFSMEIPGQFSAEIDAANQPIQ